MLRAIGSLANYITPTRPDTRLPQDDQTNQLKGEVPPVTPEDSPQLVMGIPDLRHEEDDEETSFLQPEPKEEPRDNDQVKQAAQHTILTEPDEERKGQSEVPQSEENKERFTRQEKELTQKSSSSTGEADNRGSGANILPPDVVKGQAENEDNEEEMKLREIYSMIKDQRNMVMHVQRNQEDMQRKQQEFIIDTVQKSIATEAKATQKLMMEQKMEIIQLLHSPAKKIDWSEASDDEDEISPKPETKSTDIKFDTILKFRMSSRLNPKSASDLMKNPEDFEEGNEMIKDASRDLDFGVQILEGYDGNNRLANGVNGRVTMPRSSDQDSKNEDLSFGLWKCLKIL